MECFVSLFYVDFACQQKLGCVSQCWFSIFRGNVSERNVPFLLCKNYMETTKHKLTPVQEDFFAGLKSYIGLPVYFYGSIQRPDYLPGQSDIDVDIFTPNPSGTILQLSNYLKIDKREFRKSVHYLGSVMYGYKAKYELMGANALECNIEISVYDEKYKDAVLKEHTKHENLSVVTIFILYILKWMYYNTGLMSRQTYAKCKQTLMNEGGKMKYILF